jgi:transcriptional regulator with XRE-family HTH domain
MVSIAHKIKAIRIRRDLSQKGLSKVLGLSQTAIYHKEAGNQEFSLEQLLIICKELKFDPHYIIDDMSVEAADLEGEANTLLKAVQKKLVTLNEKQLSSVNEFISSL